MNEDEQGEPFVGKAGQILRNAIDVLGLEPDKYRLTNVVRCRPPDNRTPKRKELECCSKFIEQEIRQYNPHVIVLLGASALKSVLGESGITQYNGVVIERDGMTYVPAFHPSYFNYGNSDKLDDWLEALNNAIQVADGKQFNNAEDDYEFIYPQTVDDVHVMRDELLAYDKHVTYDVETVWLNPYQAGNKILSVSLAVEDAAWSFPIDHKEAWWEKDERYEVVASLASVLKSKRIVGHNVRFDCKQTRLMLGVDFKPWGCTQNVSQLADSRKGIHGLKRLAGIHLGMYDYDKELQDYVGEHPDCNYDKGGNYDNVPLGKLLPYGARDAAATWKLYGILYEQLTPAQRNLYHEMIIPADYMLGIMESNGFLLDKALAKRYWQIYECVQREVYYQRLLEDPDVRDYISDRQSQMDKAHMARQAKSNRELRRYEFEFNPNSSDQMADIFYGCKGHKIPAKTATGKPTVSMKIIKNSSVADDPIFEDYRRWKLLATMVSKYLSKPVMGDWDVGDDRVRVNFNIGGAKTGRLSSSQPTNLQNIPAPEKEPGTLLEQLPIKNIFRATWIAQPKYEVPVDDKGRVKTLYDEWSDILCGKIGCVASIDYASMELRVMASLSNCEGMIQAFKGGYDPHCYVTRMVFRNIVGEADDKTIKERFKEYRYRAKWTNWTLLFGGDEHTLHSTYRLPLDEAKSIVYAYYDRFPEILDFQESTKTFIRETGYVENPFGRRLYLPDINDNDRSRVAEAERTGVNMPIQGTASDILLCALVITGDKMCEYELRTMLVNTVHDSIVGDVYPGELPQFAVVCIDAMENVDKYAVSYFPNLDFSWLKVPLVADVEVGTHYGSLRKYGVN